MRSSSGNEAVILSDELEVVLTPDKGCDIRQVTVRRTGETCLWKTPWTAQRARSDTGDSSTESWLMAYPGGWQLMLPNAGDRSVADGRAHGLHGEASMARWQTTRLQSSRAEARLECFVLPLTIDRVVEVVGATVTVTDTVTNTGLDPVRFIWGHHPGFGGDILRGGAQVQIQGRRVTADTAYDPMSNPLAPGSESRWPSGTGKNGEDIDLTDLVEGRSLVAYVDDLVCGRAALMRNDGLMAAELEWDADLFPCVWLWVDLAGNSQPPWFGRARVVGIEPCSTMPGHGLADAIAQDANLVRLQPSESRAGTVRLTVLDFGATGP